MTTTDGDPTMTIATSLRGLGRAVAGDVIKERMSIALGAILATNAIAYAAPHVGMRAAAFWVVVATVALAFIPGLIIRLKTAKTSKETPDDPRRPRPQAPRQLHPSPG